MGSGSFCQKCPAGRSKSSAATVANWQEAYGVKCSGTHSGWVELRPENIEETIRYHKTIGNPNYIIPGADLSTLEKIDEFCAVMNAAKPRLEAEGIRLGYHNHSHECDCDFEIDTYWAFNAGLDPIQVLDRLADRIRVIHLKDGFRGGRGMALGEGEAPVAAVRKKAIEMGILMVVESESLTPDGISEVGRCMDFLRKCDAAD